MCSDVAISVKNLTKTYRIFGHPGDRIKQVLTFGQTKFHKEFAALRDVSFEIKKGDTVGIIGRNGSGKSTLLQLICGILKPTSGTVEVKGRISALLELGAGFNPEFTGRENVYFQGAVMGFTKAQMDERFDAIAAFADIGEFIDLPVRTYSSGMFVRLAFAVAIHADPDILIVDEALAVGDFAFQQKCIRLLRENLSDTTKIIVSHDLATLAAMTKRILVLHENTLVYIGDSQTAIARYQQTARASRDTNATPSHLESDHPGLALDRDAVPSISLNKIIQSGAGNAFFTHANWKVADKCQSKTIIHGDSLSLQCLLEVRQPICEPIVGYQVQNRTGVVVFGENTLSSGFTLQTMDPGNYLLNLGFKWPNIQGGDYGITIGLGNGTESCNHVVECWAHNVIHLTNLTQHHHHGLFSVPLSDFSLSEVDAN